jgi:hypothetical protein
MRRSSCVLMTPLATRYCHSERLGNQGNGRQQSACVRKAHWKIRTRLSRVQWVNPPGKKKLLQLRLRKLLN